MNVITACNGSPTVQSSAANTSPIVTPSIASSPAPSPASSIQTAGARSPQHEAVQVIRDYYRAIDRRDYEQAYLAWDDKGAASYQSFEQFKQGFVNTKSTAVEIGESSDADGAAGSSYIQIPVTVTATTTNGTPQQFHGSYVLRRVNDVPSSTLEQRRWHLYSAKIAQVH